jgi:hypothetical protein
MLASSVGTSDLRFATSGDATAAVELLGCSYLFRGLAGSLADQVTRRYRRWPVLAGHGDTGCVIDCIADRAQWRDPADFDCRGQYAVRVDRGTWELSITGFDFHARLFQSASGRANVGEIRYFPQGDDALTVVVENVLRILVADSAVNSGGLLMHSAGLVLNGEALIFCGHSGAGKTTLARKAHACGVPVLSDDLNLLLPTPMGYQAFPVPFAGEFSAQTVVGGAPGFPLAGLYFLRQGEALALETLTRSQAVARIIGASPFVNRDVDRFDVVTANAVRLVAAVPWVAVLTSCRDDDFRRILSILDGDASHA